MAFRRPDPFHWVLYAFGAKLPARNREWVLHDVTTRTWQLRHVARATVQLAPIAIALYLFIPGEPWVRVMAVLGGALIGYFYSLTYMYESAEHRAMKAGYPQGYAANVREESHSEANAERRRRYEDRWR
ncbi:MULTISPECIES: DUF5313 family protein [unclassified Pseudonocardia]|jgi:hypothetical protein|uniref:DUF5313 family protein n=1 Tax=unclassified Pseudonocardia TaxID=2619320 RepID=UPI0031019BCC